MSEKSHNALNAFGWRILSVVIGAHNSSSTARATSISPEAWGSYFSERNRVPYVGCIVGFLSRHLKCYYGGAYCSQHPTPNGPNESSLPETSCGDYMGTLIWAPAIVLRSPCSRRKHPVALVVVSPLQDGCDGP